MFWYYRVQSSCPSKHVLRTYSIDMHEQRLVCICVKIANKWWRLPNLYNSYTQRVVIKIVKNVHLTRSVVLIVLFAQKLPFHYSLCVFVSTIDYNTIQRSCHKPCIYYLPGYVGLNYLRRCLCRYTFYIFTAILRSEPLDVLL